MERPGLFPLSARQLGEAEESLRKAVAVDAKHARAWINLGLALGQQGKYSESTQAFEKAVRPAKARCNLAFVMSTQGKFEKAREFICEALKLDPGTPSCAASAGEAGSTRQFRSDSAAAACAALAGMKRPAERIFPAPLDSERVKLSRAIGAAGSHRADRPFFQINEPLPDRPFMPSAPRTSVQATTVHSPPCTRPKRSPAWFSPRLLSRPRH